MAKRKSVLKMAKKESKHISEKEYALSRLRANLIMENRTQFKRLIEKVIERIEQLD